MLKQAIKTRLIRSSYSTAPPKPAFPSNSQSILKQNGTATRLNQNPEPKDPFAQPSPDFKYAELSTSPFPDSVVKVLSSPIDPLDVEVKPDGILYMPEIKYRRLLMQAFGPGFNGVYKVDGDWYQSGITLSLITRPSLENMHYSVMEGKLL